jgi:hypothetical protein
MLTMKLPEFLTSLECVVLRELLQTESEDVQNIREQLASCSLESRESNGYGFFTNFHVDNLAPRCARENFELGDVSVVLSGQLCGFILFVRGGVIDFWRDSRLAVTNGPHPKI